MLVSLHILFVLLEQVKRRHAKDNYFNSVCVCFSYTTLSIIPMLCGLLANKRQLSLC